MPRFRPPASSRCWTRPAPAATPGTPSSPPATSPCATSPRRATRRLHRVGPPARDRSLFSRLPGPHAPLEEADAIVCTGLRNSLKETVEAYRDLIEAGVARKMPFVCANPDLVVDVGETRHLCAGSIAAEYEQRGGDVFWAGKPHPSAYGTALQVAGELRGRKPELARVLGVGDAVRTDLAAAKGLGVDGLFITSRHPQRYDHDRRPGRPGENRGAVREPGDAAGRCRDVRAEMVGGAPWPM